LGIRFTALGKMERAAVAAYVRGQYDKLIFQQPTSYVSKNPQTDPECWQDALRELIASDPKRVQAIAEAAGSKANLSSGFTLIELSIVLVIIGLIVGGILVGQNLIAAAGVRATVSQIEKYNTAVNTFRDKYGALPGDITASAAAQFGFDYRTGGVADGDGNGFIEGCWYPHSEFYGCETALFWRDLGDAKLIDGSFDAIYPSNSDGDNPINGVTTSEVPSYLPAAKLGGGNYLAVFNGGYVWNSGSPIPAASAAGTVGNNYFFLGAVTSIAENYITGAGLTPAQAYAIDNKMDDGQPLTGNVQSVLTTFSFFNQDIPSPTGCSTSNTAYNLAPTYSSQVLCDMAFKFQ